MEIDEARELRLLAEQVNEHVLGEEGAAWAERLDAYVEQLGPAAETLLAAGEEEEALRLVAALSRYAQASGRVEEVRAVSDQVLASVGDIAASAPLARALLVQGELAFRQGDQPVAAEATRAALEAGRAAGDTWAESGAEMNLARVAFRDGDAPRIFEHAERMLALGSDDLRTRAGAVHMLGWAEYTAGNVPGAITRFEENVRLYRAAGNLVGMASELANLGDLAAEAGELERARAFLQESLEIAVQTESRYLLPSLLASAASIAGLQSRYAETIELAAAADAQYAAAGLTPDPGDGVIDGLRAVAVKALGEPDAEELAARGRARTLDGAVELARAVLG